MRLADRTRAARRGLAYLALVATAGVTALMLSQCKMVDERLTAVASPEKGGAANCFSQCARDFADSVRAEAQVHVNNVKACGSDDACKALEEIRHEAAIDRINAGRLECQQNCHHQGSGSGGR